MVVFRDFVWTTTNGSAELSITGGTAPYSVLWSNNKQGVKLDSVQAGSYTYVVKDANLCSYSNAVAISQPDLLKATSSVKQVSCKGNADGSIQLTISGGTAPYSLTWSDGSQNSSIASLSPGKYAYLVKDSLGCSISDTIQITEPSHLSVSSNATSVLCKGGNTGSISLKVSGGTSPYKYQWSNGSTDSSLVNLLSGSYSYTVRDANGCSTSDTVKISEPLAMSVTHDIFNVKCQSQSTGSATLTVNGGTAPYQYLWSNGATTSTLSNVKAGTYTCVITDANKCTIGDTVRIIEPKKLTVKLSFDEISCNGGTTQVLVSAEGGVPPYSGIGLFTKISGTHTFTVKDSNNCSVVMTGLIKDAPSINAPSTRDLSLCLGKIFDKTAIVYDTTKSLRWYSDTLGTAISGPDMTYIGTKTYYVSQQSSNGCESSKTPIKIAIIDPSLRVEQNPIDRSVCKGQSAVFSVVASGNISSYQWQLNGVNIEGATNATLVISNVDESKIGEYRCIVSNTCASATSLLARLGLSSNCGYVKPDNSDCFDLALRNVLLGTKKQVIASDTLTYQISVYNQGCQKAYNVDIMNHIPSGMALVNPSSWGLIDNKAVHRIESISPGDSVLLYLKLRFDKSAVTAYFVNVAEIIGADLDTKGTQHITQDRDSRYDENPKNDIGSKVDSPTDNVIWGDGDGKKDIVGGILPEHDEDDQDPEGIQLINPGCFDLALRKELKSGKIAPMFMAGDSATFVLTIYNQCSQTDAYQVKVIDYIPKGMSLVRTGSWNTSIDTTWSSSKAIVSIDTNAVLHLDKIPANDSVKVEITLAIQKHFVSGTLINRAEIFEAALDKEGKFVLTHDNDSRFDRIPNNDIGGRVNSPTDNVIWGDGDARYDVVNGTIIKHDEDDEDPALVVVGIDGCLEVSADSVKGNRWFDLYDGNGRLYASINPNGMNLGRVTLKIRHYGNGWENVPTTPLGTKLMSRYYDLKSSVRNTFADTLVSTRIYYTYDELSDYKTATKLSNLTINDFNIVRYNGINENCGFEDNDNFNHDGYSEVLYKGILGKEVNQAAYYLQFNLDRFSEVGATANKFALLSECASELVENNKAVRISWLSGLEVRYDKYIVQRSKDCKTFETLAEIDAKGAGIAYEYIDHLPYGGNSCYRLVYVDKDGTHKVMDVKKVSNGNDTFCKVYPNPIEDYQNINLYIRGIEAKEIQMFDAIGQQVGVDWILNNYSNVYRIIPSVDIHSLNVIIVTDKNGNKCIVKVIAPR